MLESAQALVTAFDHLSAELHKARRRDFIRNVLIGAALVVLIFLAFGNRNILGIVESATNPDGEIAKRGQASTAKVVVGISVEIDCRVRRALVHLPTPPLVEPYVPCTSLPDNPLP